ncbi:MAG: hypothetical protein EA426_01435 [Spirochaetaceae bacterium]|nr:MAG: hypothetical protein EA426_01435 [Spirochaetaceae bacterium]
MSKIISLAVIFGVVGLVVGYLIFARAPVTGNLIPIGDLFRSPQNVIGQFVQSVGQFAEIRRNILFTGAGGIALGAILGVVIGRR